MILILLLKYKFLLNRGSFIPDKIIQKTRKLLIGLYKFTFCHS